MFFIMMKSNLIIPMVVNADIFLDRTDRTTPLIFHHYIFQKGSNK